MLYLTDDVMEGILNAMIATDGEFDPAALFIGVASNVANPGGGMTIADVTPATGSLATRKASASWGTPYKLTDGRWVVDGPVVTFFPTTTADGQSISWAYLADALTAGNLLAAFPINPSVNLPGPTSHWNCILRLTVDPSGRWEANITFNG